ncbi:restriction endonuclease subunit S [Macellibacteroides fermentans]|uniref:restriction endonuclease subunit S n=1 Tax=Macellibacteroides fermentans TaxID=879969 RepID=UPI00406C352D
MSGGYPKVKLSEVLSIVERPITPKPGVNYRQLGVKLWGQGAYERDILEGSNTRYTSLFQVEKDDVVVNKIWARNGSVAVVQPELSGCYVSAEFPTFVTDKFQLLPKWMDLLTKSQRFWSQCNEKSQGTSGKNRIRSEQFLQIEIPLPSLDKQRRLIAYIDGLTKSAMSVLRLQNEATLLSDHILDSDFQITLTNGKEKKNWEYDKLSNFVSVNPKRDAIHLGINDEVSFIPMRAVDDKTGRIIWPEVRKLSEVSTGYTFFKENDVIFARITPCMENGKSAIAEKLINGVGFGSTEFIVLRPNGRILPEWLHYVIRSKDFRQNAEANFKGTAGQQRVPISFISSVIIPVPPLNEQKKLIEYFNNINYSLYRIKKINFDMLAEIKAFIPSILNKAYTGEL